MLRSIALASLVTLILGACATPQEHMQQEVASAIAACRQMGYQDGTDQMRQCEQNIYRDEALRDQQRRGLAAMILMSHPLTVGTPVQPVQPMTRPSMTCDTVSNPGGTATTTCH